MPNFAVHLMSKPNRNSTKTHHRVEVAAFDKKSAVEAASKQIAKKTGHPEHLNNINGVWNLSVPAEKAAHAKNVVFSESLERTNSLIYLLRGYR